MDANISAFRGSKRVRYMRYAILAVTGDLKSLIGKKVSWTSPGKVVINGKITGLHGKKSVKAYFERGLPGQALGTKVVVA